MSLIQTVTDLVDSEAIDHAQCHEHIWLNKGKSYEINPMLCIDDFEKSKDELISYKSKGGNLIVDAQPVGCGRNAMMLKDLSRKSNVMIVGSTGFHKMLFYPDNHWIHSIEAIDFEELMVKEIEFGMYLDGDLKFPCVQTDIKAGMIKIAGDKEGITPRYDRLYRAAAKASVKTGLTIQCHIEISGQGDEISELLISEGVKPSKIILAHMDRADKSQDELLKVLQKGLFLQFDTIGRYKYHSDETEIELIKTLIDYGFEDQLLIGLDTTRGRLKSYDGSIGLTYILEEFLASMKEAGISQKIIEKIIRRNPQKALRKK